MKRERRNADKKHITRETKSEIQRYTKCTIEKVQLERNLLIKKNYVAKKTC